MRESKERAKTYEKQNSGSSLDSFKCGAGFWAARQKHGG
jgi:hypothetical protein